MGTIYKGIPGGIPGRISYVKSPKNSLEKYQGEYLNEEQKFQELRHMWRNFRWISKEICGGIIKSAHERISDAFRVRIPEKTFGGVSQMILGKEQKLQEFRHKAWRNFRWISEEILGGIPKGVLGEISEAFRVRIPKRIHGGLF